MAREGNVFYAKHRFNFGVRQYKRLRRHLELLSEMPEEAWAIYGEDVGHLVEGMWLTLCEVRHNRRKALGRTGPRRDRNIYKPDIQQRLRREKWEKLPYCEAPAWTNCPVEGQKLTWEQAQLDHIVAVTDGGDTTHENTRLVCAICHSVITANTRSEKRTQQGRIPHWYRMGTKL